MDPLPPSSPTSRADTRRCARSFIIVHKKTRRTRSHPLCLDTDRGTDRRSRAGGGRGEMDPLRNDFRDTDGVRDFREFSAQPCESQQLIPRAASCFYMSPAIRTETTGQPSDSHSALSCSNASRRESSGRTAQAQDLPGRRSKSVGLIELDARRLTLHLTCNIAGRWALTQPAQRPRTIVIMRRAVSP